MSQMALSVFQADLNQKYEKTIEQFSDVIAQDAETQKHQISSFFLNFNQSY